MENRAMNESPWQRVLRRDPNAPFLYSVRTTGVYCRPDCPSRRPREANVDFHADAAAAEAAGFRPCRRCRPNEPTLRERQGGVVTKACRAIEEAPEAPPALAELAGAAGMSKFHFLRTFKAIAGMTPKAYALAHRAARVRRNLPSAKNVTEAVYASGFGSSSRFYEDAAATLGMKPATFRAHGRGARIRVVVTECTLGTVLVAATEKGLCAVAFGDDLHELTRQLRERFNAATFAPSDPKFDALVAGVVAQIDDPAGRRDLPLDIRGTAFQERVWQALRDIAPGTTQTYGEVAARVGMPRGARAVARACATNELAVVVPCHRVVAANGSLAGYRWGLERKRNLLARERKV
jgi:AraC family transcriptional regulator of adaptative response/methylated-DNA-[protein]-cysteine methyltransferase